MSVIAFHMSVIAFHMNAACNLPEKPSSAWLGRCR